ncbi:major capsid protein [Actinomadura nitritigenes]|uniref:major capsid protein n=1 Tax=Actinomadura nitritigenes TaxID=134602 RepID=UPI003D92546A
MPVTLAQAQINAADDVDYAVIDNFRRYSWLLDQMVWDDTVTPGTGGGSSLTYAYTRLIEAAPAQFRRLNTEYTPGQAKRARFSVDLKPLGGAVTIDRVIARLGNPATTEVNFQMQQMLASTRGRFQQALILGDPATEEDEDGFEGLDRALTGTATEYFPGGDAMYADWTTAAVDTADKALTRLDELDDFLSRLVPSTVGSVDIGAPGALPPGVRAILGNTRSITRLRSMARRAGQYTATKDDLGRDIEMYGQWTLVDVGDRFDGASPIIPIESRDPDGAGGGAAVSGLTDIYAVCFGMDSFHGASMAGVPLVETWLPDYTTSGAVKSGEVEFGPVAPVLKNTKAAGVLRNVKV